MKVDFKFPLEFYVTGGSPEDLNIEAQFSDKKYHATLRFEGNDPLKMSGESSEPFYRLIKFAHFLIDVPQNNFGELTDGVAKEKLVTLLLKVVNRTLRNIRNIGMVAQIKEVGKLKESPDFYLGKWNVVVYEDSAVRVDFGKENSKSMHHLLLGYMSRYENKASVSCSQWRDIVHGIEDDAPVAPEAEFLVNALQYSQQDDFRYAILEAVMGLEILVAQYLKLALEGRGILKKHISPILGPGLDLKNKIAVLVPLLLKGASNQVNLESVLMGINMRNKIMHSGGKIPDGHVEEDIRECVSSVVILSNVLGLQIFNMERAEDYRAIKSALKEKHKGLTLDISSNRKHHYFVIVSVGFIRRNEVDILSIAKDVEEQVQKIDDKCSPEKLVVEFFRLNEKIYQYTRSGLSKV